MEEVPREVQGTLPAAQGRGSVQHHRLYQACFRSTLEVSLIPGLHRGSKPGRGDFGAHAGPANLPRIGLPRPIRLRFRFPKKGCRSCSAAADQKSGEASSMWRRATEYASHRSSV